MNYAACLQEFSGAAELLKPKHGVTTLEQLVRETKKRQAEKAKHAAAKDKAVRERLEAEEEDAIAQMEAEALANVGGPEQDKPEPNPMQQCLFLEHADATAAPCLEDTDLQERLFQTLTDTDGNVAGAGAAAETTHASAAEAGADTGGADTCGHAARADRQEAVRQLLAGGQLGEYCAVLGRCPAGIAQELFRLTTCCNDYVTAQQSCEALVSLLGRQPTCQPLAQLQPVDISSAEQYDGPHSSGCSIEWLPSDEDLLTALHNCGYRSPGTAGDAKPLRSPQGKHKTKSATAGSKRVHPESPGEHQGTGSSETELLVARLQLLLRFLAALCYYDQEGGKRRNGMRTAGLQRLVAALLRLRLDPAASPLSTHLHAALIATLQAVSAKDWRSVVPSLVADIASLGPNHRSQLVVLQALPEDAGRGEELRAAAATLLLHRLVPPLTKGRAPAQPSLLDIDAQAVVQTLWWQQHGGETRKAAQAAYKGNAKFDVWELDTAVRVADMLLWRDTRALAARANADKAAAGDAVRLKYIRSVGWHTTLRTLHNELRNVTGAWQMPSIRLAAFVDCIDQRNRLATAPQLD